MIYRNVQVTKFLLFFSSSFTRCFIINQLDYSMQFLYLILGRSILLVHFGRLSRAIMSSYTLSIWSFHSCSLSFIEYAESVTLHYLTSNSLRALPVSVFSLFRYLYLSLRLLSPDHSILYLFLYTSHFISISSSSFIP